MQLKSIKCSGLKFNKKYNKVLNENVVFNLKNKTIIPTSFSISQPFWLLNSSSQGSYNFESFKMKGNSENQPSAEFEITIEIGNDKLHKRPGIVE